jgi:hypothetical protein
MTGESHRGLVGNVSLAWWQEEEGIVDERIKVKDRDRRGKRGFNFIKPGTFVKQAEQIRNRERNKLMAGFLSGRNANARMRDTFLDMDDDA